MNFLIGFALIMAPFVYFFGIELILKVTLAVAVIYAGIMVLHIGSMFKKN